MTWQQVTAACYLICIFLCPKIWGPLFILTLSFTKGKGAQLKCVCSLLLCQWFVETCLDLLSSQATVRFLGY